MESASMIAVRSFLASLPVNEGSNESSDQNELFTKHNDNEYQSRFELQNDIKNTQVSRLK